MKETLDGSIYGLILLFIGFYTLHNISMTTYTILISSQRSFNVFGNVFVGVTSQNFLSLCINYKKPPIC